MIKVLNGGIEVLVEDWPGRLGYMGLGMAAAGALDNLALQLGNLIIGNEAGEAGLEIAGGYCEFEIMRDGVLAITGSDMAPTISGEPAPLWEAVAVKKGDVLNFSHFGDAGFRSYVCIAGGIDVPEYLGSKSTCLFGSYGGYEGRKLLKDDVIQVLEKRRSWNRRSEAESQIHPEIYERMGVKGNTGTELSTGLCNS